MVTKVSAEFIKKLILDVFLCFLKSFSGDEQEEEIFQHLRRGTSKFTHLGSCPASFPGQCQPAGTPSSSGLWHWVAQSRRMLSLHLPLGPTGALYLGRWSLLLVQILRVNTWGKLKTEVLWQKWRRSPVPGASHPFVFCVFLSMW